MTSIKQCRVCKIELKKGENVKRTDVKICTICLEKEKQELEDKKTEGKNKIQCNKCKKYCDEKEFLKILKNCMRCREQTAKKGKKEEDCNSSDDNKIANEIYITAKQIFNYLKNKYDIEDEYDEVVEEIIQTNHTEENLDNE